MSQGAESIWLYCINCERAFLSDSKNSCLYDSCDGRLGEIWEWGAILELNRNYPAIPLDGKEYPLYSDGRFTNLERTGRDEDCLPGAPKVHKPVRDPATLHVAPIR